MTTDNIPASPRQYGTFSNRMLAAVIDLGILFMIALPLVDLVTGYFFAPVNPEKLIRIMNSPELQNNPPQLLSALWKELSEQHAIQRLVTENLLQIAFIALYLLPFWFKFSATPGKMLFRMEIIDDASGNPMSYKQAVMRFLGYIVSALPLSLGFLWVLLNRRKRGFHDLVAGTVVVVKPKKEYV